MKRSPKDLVSEVIEAARANPAQAAVILGDASRRFRHYAKHPANRSMARVLQDAANQFATAADAGRATVNDFDEMTAETAQAHAEVGQHGDLEIEARQQALHQAKRGVRRVSIVPESVDEGTVLGRSATVRHAPTSLEIVNGIVESKSVVFWQGKKEEAQALTLDIGVSDFPAPPATLITDVATFSICCRPYALIAYGVDGFQSEVRIDVGLGQKITIPGNYVSALVGMDPPRAGSVSGIMTIGGRLGFFAAPSAAPVTRTVLIDSLEHNASVSIVRPQRSVRILPPMSSTNGAQMRLDFYDSGTTLMYTLTFFAGSVVAPIPVVNGVFRIVLTNLDPATSDFQLPFELAL